MKHITRNIEEHIYSSPLLDFYFHGMTMATLDIETTGLSASWNKFILGGLYDIQNGVLHQYFADNRQEESQILGMYMDELSRFDVIITFNGKHFDMPFLEKRYAHLFHKDYPDRLPYNFDLYLLLNGHSPIKNFVPNLKQKTVENYMGLWPQRSDEISGAESVDLYNEFEKSQDPELARQILLHNSDDVMQLARLLRVTSKCDMHKGLYKLGFPVGSLTVSRVHVQRDCLEITGIQRGAAIDYRSFEIDGYPAQLHFDGRNRDFRILIPTIRDRGLTVIDLYAAGVETTPFEVYPSYSSGFLAIETADGPGHMEINHFIKQFMGKVLKFMREEL